MWSRSKALVPEELVAAARAALARVDDEVAALERLTDQGATLVARREQRRRTRRAIDEADVLLRQAAAATRGRSHREWSRWRRRVSRLSLARHVLAFAESDEIATLPVHSVRAVDTGMSGPSIGELQHGASRPPGSPARYGLDLDAALASPSRVRVGPPRPAARPAARPAPRPAARPAPRPAAGPAPEAA